MSGKWQYFLRISRAISWEGFWYCFRSIMLLRVWTFDATRIGMQPNSRHEYTWVIFDNCNQWVFSRAGGKFYHQRSKYVTESSKFIRRHAALPEVQRIKRITKQKLFLHLLNFITQYVARLRQTREDIELQYGLAESVGELCSDSEYFYLFFQGKMMHTIIVAT